MILLAGSAPAAPQFPWWPEGSGKTLSEFNRWQHQRLQQMHKWVLFFIPERRTADLRRVVVLWAPENPHHTPALQKDPAHSSGRLLWALDLHRAPFTVSFCYWQLHLMQTVARSACFGWKEQMGGGWSACVFTVSYNFYMEKKAKTDNPECCHDEVLQEKTRKTLDQVAHCYFSTYLARTRLQKYLFFLKVFM